MSKTLYLECYAGISGDMTVAALLDLGASRIILEQALQSLPISGYSIEINRVKKAGLDACNFCVHLDKKHENHDHDMAYLHGADKHTHGEHAHIEHQDSGDNHDSLHQEYLHEHRGLAEILAIIEQAQLTERAKGIASRIFTILAEAEAKAHGVPLAEVHFHEVGAVDSIVDIVAIAVCVDNLDITETAVSDLYEGRGFVRCQHGMIPVPVPAVTHIVGNNNLNLHLTQTEGELVTPTGAAAAAALKTIELPKQFQILNVGMGAGKRTYDRPSIVRAMLIEANNVSNDTIWKLESNLDDCSGEALGFVLDELFGGGARDVYYTPIYMKKNRPAYQLNVICDEDNIKVLEEIIFKHTTTIGIRRHQLERTVLKRTEKKVMTTYGEVAVKICELPSGVKVYPEYESVAKVAQATGRPFGEVYQTIVKECDNKEKMF